jgi:exodeoxyribonuclease VII small subunit
MPQSPQKNMEDLTFEQAYAELDGLVNALEQESQPLEQSIALYERGQALARHCAALLEKAELKVKQLNMQAPTESFGDR